MTDLLLQAKDRLLTAELNYQEASDVLNLAMKLLEAAKKKRSDAQINFETKALNYSLALQNANHLEDSLYLSESSIIEADHDLDVAKKEYDAAQGIKQAQEAISHAAVNTLAQAQTVYNLAKLEFESADYDHTRLLREKKMSRFKESEPLETRDASSDNIDFLMNFLNYPLSPDKDTSIKVSPIHETASTYDSSIPFEKRPAIERPIALENQLSLNQTITGKLRTGHITWDFETPIPPNNKNELEKKTDD